MWKSFPTPTAPRDKEKKEEEIYRKRAEKQANKGKSQFSQHMKNDSADWVQQTNLIKPLKTLILHMLSGLRPKKLKRSRE